MTHEVTVNTLTGEVKTIQITGARLAAIQVENAAHADRIPDYLRRALLNQFRKEALSRIAAIDDDLDDASAVKAYVAMWEANPPPSPTADQLKMKNIFQFVKQTAKPKLAALDEAALRLVNPLVNDPFGDGTVWP